MVCRLQRREAARQLPLIEDNSVRSGSTSLVNTRVGYALSKTLTVRLDGYNLLNRNNNDIDIDNDIDIEYYYQSQLAFYSVIPL